MARDTGEFSRRRVLTTTVLGGLAGALAGCGEVDTTGDSTPESEPVEEPDEPPEPLQDGVDVDALRDRTAAAIAQQAFSVTGIVSYLQGGDEVQSSRAKTGRGDPEAETALHVNGSSEGVSIDDPNEGEITVERYFDDAVFRRSERSGDTEYGRQEGGYEDFTGLVTGDLDGLHEIGTDVEFGDPEWDETEAVYRIEGVGLEGETAEQAVIESCRLSVDADGVVVGIDATLSAKSDDNDQRVRARIDGDAGIDVNITEPGWLDQVTGKSPVWTYETGSRPSTSVVGETIYVSSSTGVAAVDRSDGTETWQFEASGPRLTQAVADGMVHVGGIADAVYALDAADGSERWRQSVEEPVGAPVVVDDVVVHFGGGSVRGFDTADGTPRWSVPLEGVALSRMIADGTVYVGDNSGTVYAVDPAAGEEAWRFDSPTDDWVRPDTVVDGRVYAGGFEGGVYCIDDADGTGVWDVMTADMVTSVAVADSTVYAGNRAGEVYGLDADDGDEAWRSVTGDTAHVHPDGEALYVASHDRILYRLSADDGTRDWTFETAGRIEEPTITDDAIYVGSRDRRLYAIDPAEGTQYWRRELDFWARGAPVVRDDLLYAVGLGSDRSVIYAFEPYDA